MTGDRVAGEKTLRHIFKDREVAQRYAKEAFDLGRRSWGGRGKFVISAHPIL